MSNNSPIKGFRKLGGLQPENTEQEKIPPESSQPPANPWQQPIAPVQPVPQQQVAPPAQPPASPWQQPVPPAQPVPQQQVGSALPSGWQAQSHSVPQNPFNQPAPQPDIRPHPSSTSAPKNSPVEIGWNKASAYSQKRSQAVNELRHKFGAEVAHGQALLTGFGPYAEKIGQVFEILWHQRNIPSTTIEPYNYKGLEQYLLLTQTFTKEEKLITGRVLVDKATIAIQVAPYGNDLIVEYWHFELASSRTSQKAKVGRFAIFFFVGIILLFAGGIGLFVILYGFYQLFTKNLEGDAREKSELLNHMMQESLMMAIHLAVNSE